jgi:hypothetical protein
MPADSDEPEFDDYGEPAESDLETDPPTGTSGADEGISPWSPEQYEQDPSATEQE